MFVTEVIVTDSLNRAISLDLMDAYVSTVTMAIADIRTPDKRDSSHTKTVKLYGTKKNNEFFEHIYEVNLVTRRFNVNLKTPCIIYDDSHNILEGSLQLKEIEIIKKNDVESIVYSCTVFGQNNDLFLNIGNDLLEELDFSKYNHPYTYFYQVAANSGFNLISGVYTPVIDGQGYRYPLIDYGDNGFATNFWKMEWIRPGLFAKEYWDAIFAAAGKTYSGPFISDTTKPFVHLIIPHNGDAITMSAATKANLEASVGMTGDGPATNKSMALTPTFSYTTWSSNVSSTATTVAGGNSLDCVFDDESTSPFSDPGSIYNPVTGIFTIGGSGIYQFSGLLSFEVKMNYPATATSTVNVFGLNNWAFKLLKSTDGGVTWSIAQTISATSTTIFNSSYQVNQFVISTTPINMVAGHKYKISIQYLPSEYMFKDVSSNPVTTGTASFDIKLDSAATMKIVRTDTNIIEGNTMVMNDVIPKGIKQKDFLMSIIRMFNLYFTVDKTNPNNYIIEQRDEFYANGKTVDWTEKWAVNMPTMIKPMSEIDAKVFKWQYKKDEDYYNKQYYSSYNESYGSKKLTIDNDFLKNDNVTEVIFSPTPVVDNSNNEIIIPKIFSYDGTVTKRMKHNIRILYWLGDILGTTLNFYTIQDSFGANPGNSYAGTAMVYGDNAGMGLFGNVKAPTESIEFGIPNELFYTTPAYTNNNLYNRFYSRFFNEITDRDSKIVVMYLKLDPVDIATFDFRNTVFIEDTFYLVNKIIDYNPMIEDLTKVELLKIKSYAAFEPSSAGLPEFRSNFNEGINVNIYGEPSTNTRVGAANNTISGDNINTKSIGSILSGSNISICESCYMVNVISSSEVLVNKAVSGTSVLNCSGIIIGASGNMIALSGCKDMVIEDGVYNYQAFGVSNKTVTPANNNTADYGITCNFLDGSSH